MMRRLRASDPTLTELSPRCTIDEDRARVLGEALAVSSTLTALHLRKAHRDCGMTAAGSAHLAAGVGKSASLVTLYVFGQRIGDSGAPGLSRALATSSTLNNLYLGSCGIAAAGAAHLAQGVGKSASLSSLDLNDNKIGDSGAEALSMALAVSSTLCSLDLRYCEITAAGAAHLAQGVGKSASLATLSMSGNKIVDSGAEGLSVSLTISSTLTSLYLNSCGIAAAGAEHLAAGVSKSVSLVTLDLSGNTIGDRGAEVLGKALAASSTLTTLYLGSCEITAAGAAHIAHGVKQGPPRRVPLKLWGVELGSAQAAQVGLLDVAGGWDTHKVLAALNAKCKCAAAAFKAGQTAPWRQAHSQNIDADMDKTEVRAAPEPAEDLDDFELDLPDDTSPAARVPATNSASPEAGGGGARVDDGVVGGDAHETSQDAVKSHGDIVVAADHLGEAGGAEGAGSGDEGGGDGSLARDVARVKAVREAALLRELESTKYERDVALRKKAQYIALGLRQRKRSFLRLHQQAIRNHSTARAVISARDAAVAERDAVSRDNMQRHREIREKDETIRLTEAAIEARDQIIRSKDAELREKHEAAEAATSDRDAAIRARDAAVVERDVALCAAVRDNLQGHRELREKDKAIRLLEAAIEARDHAIRSRDAELREKHEAAEAVTRDRDAAIHAREQLRRAAIEAQDQIIRIKDAELGEKHEAAEEANRERDAAIRARDAAVVERDVAVFARKIEKEIREKEIREKDQALQHAVKTAVQADQAIEARDELIRSKDAEIVRLRRLAYGVEVIEVEAGVTRVVEEVGAAPPREVMRQEQAASARVIGALKERLVAVKKEQGEERAAELGTCEREYAYASLCVCLYMCPRVSLHVQLERREREHTSSNMCCSYTCPHVSFYVPLSVSLYICVRICSAGESRA